VGQIHAAAAAEVIKENLRCIARREVRGYLKPPFPSPPIIYGYLVGNAVIFPVASTGLDGLYPIVYAVNAPHACRRGAVGKIGIGPVPFIGLNPAPDNVGRENIVPGVFRAGPVINEPFGGIEGGLESTPGRSPGTVVKVRIVICIAIVVPGIAYCL